MRTAICAVQIDRVIVTAALQSGVTPPTICGYRVVRDTFVRSQTRVKTYSRVRVYRNCRNGVCIFLRYQPVLPGLAPFKLTLVGKDWLGLHRRDILHVLRAFSSYRLNLIEIALHFPPVSRIDAEH